MRAAVFVSLTLVGCYEGHTRGAEIEDAGTSALEGRWLVERARGGATVYDLVGDGRFVEECSSVEPAVGYVVRDADRLRCQLTGPWWSRADGKLVVDCFGEDSVARTVVFSAAPSASGQLRPTLDKVDGMTEGWSVGDAWSWESCATRADDCASACL